MTRNVFLCGTSSLLREKIIHNFCKFAPKIFLQFPDQPFESSFLSTHLNKLICKLTGLTEFIKPYEMSLNYTGMYSGDPQVAERRVCAPFTLTLCIIWAPSSEFVFSSIPSWQILTAHAQPFRGTRDLAFCLKVPLDSLLVWASNEGSGATARMHRLVWTFAARIGDKYPIRLTRSICSTSWWNHTVQI